MIPRILKSHQFWIGVGVGAVVGPYVVRRVAPSVAKKIPQ